LNQHAGADDVEGVLLWVLAGGELARGGLDLELLDDAAVEIHMARLAADFVEIVGEVHAQPGGVDRAVNEAAELSGVVNDGQDLLHAAEGEDGNQEGAAALDGVV